MATQYYIPILVSQFWECQQKMEIQDALQQVLSYLRQNATSSWDTSLLLEAIEVRQGVTMWQIVKNLNYADKSELAAFQEKLRRFQERNLFQHQFKQILSEILLFSRNA